MLVSKSDVTSYNYSPLSDDVDAVYHDNDDGGESDPPPSLSLPSSLSLRLRRRYDVSFRQGTDNQWIESLNALGCIAYECGGDNERRRIGAAVSGRTAAASAYADAPTKTTTTTYMPPYEYCSVPMFNQARLGGDHGTLMSGGGTTAVQNRDIVSDRGGTIKSILQSSKSFVHVLTTHPLKNAFRGYIQRRPYLLFGDIGLPRHHAIQIFSLNLRRDADKFVRKPVRCFACSTSSKQRQRRCPSCPF